MARQRPTALAKILDRAHPPVGKLRVMSGGLSPANTFKAHEHVAGSAACIACGNCVDACPVLLDRGVRLTVMRTSMSLETLVGTDCRRCFSCVMACPQVEPSLKDATRAHRRIERIAHYVVATSVVILSLTGLAIYYLVPTLPGVAHDVLGALHRLAAVGFIVAPLLVLAGDPSHARRTLSRLPRWTADDTRWVRDLVRFLVTFGRRGRFMRGDLNPGQRLWYLLIIGVLLTAPPTGIAIWLGESVTGAGTAVALIALHTTIARVADIGVLQHLTYKVVWPLLRSIRNTVAPRRGLQHGALWPVKRRRSPSV